MAKVVPELNEPGRTVPAHSRYPWAQWLDGRVWELNQAEDFPDERSGYHMAAIARNAAKRMRVAVRVRRAGLPSGVIRIQAVVVSPSDRERALAIAREYRLAHDDAGLEIFDDATVRLNSDNDLWVQAWVFVRRDDVILREAEENDA